MMRGVTGLKSYLKCKTYEIAGKELVRVLGTVTKVNKVSQNFTSFILDDGFGEVTIKIPERVDVKIGDIVEVFGKVKEDFVIADKIFKRDIYYEIIRLIELKRIKFEEKKAEEGEKPVEKASKDEVLNYIMNLLKEREVFELHEVYKEFEGSEDIVDRVIEKLKSEGIIFEEVPGRYRKL